MPELPKAILRHRSPNRTIWIIEFPSTTNQPGKTYTATTYPNSDLLYLQTAATKRRVSKIVGVRIHPQVREAIAVAIAKAEPTP